MLSSHSVAHPTSHQLDSHVSPSDDLRFCHPHSLFLVQHEFKTVHSRLKGDIRAVLKSRQSSSVVPVLIIGAPQSGKRSLALTMWKKTRQASSPFVEMDGELTYGQADLLRTLRRSSQGELYIKNIELLSEQDLKTIFLHSQKMEIQITASMSCEEDNLTSSFLRQFAKLFSHHINIPRLKDRPEDIELMVKHFLQQYADGLSFLPLEVSRLLCQINWEGELVQLLNCVKRSIWYAKKRGSEKICCEDVHKALSGLERSSDGFNFLEGVLKNNLYDFSKKMGIKKTLEKVEASIMALCLSEQNYNLSQTAKALHLPVNTFFSRYKSCKNPLKTMLDCL
ncbi:MAG: hypothetical protein KA436_03535 [Oligoflexales bacterium]|nr:hypothetical protein [Oligoflexales bacterium]